MTDTDQTKKDDLVSDDIESGSKTSHPQHTGGIYKIRQKIGIVLIDERFQMFIMFLIIVNSIMMGIQTFDFVEKDPDVAATFDQIDSVFLYIFTVELGFQFSYHGFNLFRDGWLFFDFLVVLVSWVSVVIGDGANLQVLRAFRIFRALRLITRVKSMRDIVNSLTACLPDLGGIFFLLSIVMYIFAVMFTTLYGEDADKYPDLFYFSYFTRLDRSLFSCFELLTLNGWLGLVRQYMTIYPFAWIPFVIYIIVAKMVFFNLILAVLYGALTLKAIETYDEDGEQQSEGEIFQAKLNELKLAQEKTRHTIEYLMTFN